jgi:hypothetical protein
LVYLFVVFCAKSAASWRIVIEKIYVLASRKNLFGPKSENRDLYSLRGELSFVGQKNIAVPSRIFQAGPTALDLDCRLLIGPSNRAERVARQSERTTNSRL